MKNKGLAEIYNIVHYLQYLSEKKESIKRIIKERLRLKKTDSVIFLRNLIEGNP